MELAGPLAGRAFRAFVATTFGMITLGVVAAVGSLWVLFSHSAVLGFAGAVCGLAVFTVAGVALAGQRAVGSALLLGLEKSQLGSRAVRSVFTALVSENTASAAGSLPLAQAEALLRSVIARLLSALGDGGGLKGKLQRKLQGSLLEKVEKLTLSRFRSERATGIDLTKVGDELAAGADRILSDQVRGMMRRVTILIVLAACVGQAVVVYLLLRRAQMN